MKLAIAGALALAVGLLGGACLTFAVMQPRLDAQRDAAEALRFERDALQRETEAAREALAAVPEPVPEPEPAAVPAPIVEAPSAPEGPEVSALLTALFSDIGPGEDALDTGDEGAADAAEDAEREARREAWADAMRENITGFLDARIEGSTNRSEQERLAAIMGYTQELFDLRGAMRNAATDEEREALRARMQEAVATLRALRDEQRDFTLNQLASEYGISRDKQQRFLRDMRRVLSDPLLRERGGPRGGGGFGGGRSRGGRGGGGQGARR